MLIEFTSFLIENIEEIVGEEEEEEEAEEEEEEAVRDAERFKAASACLLRF